MDWSIYGACVLGIVISVTLPIIWEAVYRYFPKPPRAGTTGVGFAPPTVVALWKIVTPYLLLGAASALTAILIVAFAGKTLTSPGAAVLAGYAWDSTLQKLRT